MSDARTAIVHLEEVGVCYRLAKQKILSLKEYAIHWMKGALEHEALWALESISLDIGRGESVGIVGRNGVGKSTLLKVISGVLRPTRGEVTVGGTVAPILELGTGFDPELTGLENIYLNALLLGKTRQEIRRRLEAIVDFSGLGDFVRSPIRNYSSGMYARLGFSIATAWRPDILILDEVLAVGDAVFVRSCEQRLRRFHDQGTTLLLVSHNPEALRTTCERSVWIESGRIRQDGPTEEVLAAYLEFTEGEGRAAAPAAGALSLTTSS